MTRPVLCPKCGEPLGFRQRIVERRSDGLYQHEDANGTVYLVTRCGQERSEAMRAERDAPRGKGWQR